MTETEWWGATSPNPLIDWLFYKRCATSRKFRLFWAAVCRELLPQVPDYPELAESLDLIEQVPDPEVLSQRLQVSHSNQLRALGDAAYNRVSRRGPYGINDAVWNAYLAIVLSSGSSHGGLWMTPALRSKASEEGQSWRDPGPTPRDVTDYLGHATSHQSAVRHVRVLHDIFGPLPFRDVPIAPAWLTSDVVTLARGIYDEKAFDRMPILADALQDAGCDNDEILLHCRQPDWEHVRGCWVIDLLLGRPWRDERGA